MKLISDSVKRTLQAELQDKFEDANITVIADFTTRFMGEEKMSNKDLVFILSCGNASVSNDSLKIITCPITLTCICPITYKNKNKVAQKLHDWFETYSIDKNILNFPQEEDPNTNEYYGYFDMLTPYVAGNVRNYAGQKCTDITISGNAILCQTNFSFDQTPSVNIDSTVLKKVISVNRKNTIVTNNYTVLGATRQTRIKDYVTTTITVQFIYDKTDMLHRKLAVDTDNVKHTIYVTYWGSGNNKSDNIGTTYADSEITFEKNVFNIATLTIVF